MGSRFSLLKLLETAQLTQFKHAESSVNRALCEFLLIFFLFFGSVWFSPHTLLYLRARRAARAPAAPRW